MDDSSQLAGGGPADSIASSSSRGELSALINDAAIPTANISRDLKIHSGNQPLKELLRSGAFSQPEKPHFISWRCEHEFRQAVEEAFNGKARRVPEIGVRVAPGAIVYLDARLFPAKDPGLDTVLAVFNDITGAVNDREKQKKLSQLVVIGELVRIIAHELNNPLAAVVGFSRLLKNENLTPVVAEGLEQIAQSAVQCRRVINKLLSYAKNQPLNRSDVCLNCLIAEVLASFTHELRSAGIRTRLSLDPSLPLAHVDMHQTEVAAANLIYNACQAMPDGGTLTVETRVVPTENESQLAAAAPAQIEASNEAEKTIEIRFTDTGCGIPTSIRPRIFEPFITTRGEQSVGVGLSICRGIARKHGGDVHLGQTSPGGTTFVMSLPAGRPDAPAGAPVPAPHAAIHPKPKRILVIDNEIACCKLFAISLTQDGHDVDTTGDGREAIEKLEEQSYDVVIANTKMPHVSGQKLYKAIRERNPVLAEKIVFLTDETVSSDTQDFLSRIPNPHLAKPFDVRKLNELVREL